jgi:hypothetical protein
MTLPPGLIPEQSNGEGHSREPNHGSNADYGNGRGRTSTSGPNRVHTSSIPAACIAATLTFGGSPNLPSWCLFSEMVTDLANEITNSSSYDPSILASPSQPTAPAPMLPVEQCGPARKRLPMAVTIPVTHTARVHTFIDDLINCFLDTESNRATQPHVVPLAMHCTSRPHAGNDKPITRRDILSSPKLIAEGAPREEKIVLVWMINTHLLLVKLPRNKQEDSGSGITQNSPRHHTCRHRLPGRKTQPRRLPCSPCPPLLDQAPIAHKLNRKQQQQMTASKNVSLDCGLWGGFLKKASQGTSVNRVTVRQPTQLAASDSCPFGIGGFLSEGRAWRI